MTEIIDAVMHDSLPTMPMLFRQACDPFPSLEKVNFLGVFLELYEYRRRVILRVAFRTGGLPAPAPREAAIIRKR